MLLVILIAIGLELRGLLEELHVLEVPRIVVINTIMIIIYYSISYVILYYVIV